jgi:hypothetical protein
VCDSVIEATPKRDSRYWARCALLLNDRPLFAARRTPTDTELNHIVEKVKAFGPHAVMGFCLDNVPMILALRDRCQVKALLRSQNIEHFYKVKQHKLSGGRQRLRSYFDLLGLKTFEYKALKAVDAFFDISVTDLKFWQNEGLSNGHWVPPIVMSAASSRLHGNFPSAKFDVGFIGNLWTPNNIEGVRWLITQVLPQLNQQLGRTSRTLIAGSRPDATIRELCTTTPGVELRADFDDPMTTMLDAAVLVNPMLTGSGVALKTVDMLRSARPVVSTPRGCAGLPEDVTALIKVANTSQEFAEMISESLKHTAPRVDQQDLVAERFGPAAALPIVQALE